MERKWWETEETGVCKVGCFKLDELARREQRKRDQAPGGLNLVI